LVISDVAAYLANSKTLHINIPHAAYPYGDKDWQPNKRGSDHSLYLFREVVDRKGP